MMLQTWGRDDACTRERDAVRNARENPRASSQQPVCKARRHLAKNNVSVPHATNNNTSHAFVYLAPKKIRRQLTHGMTGTSLTPGISTLRGEALGPEGAGTNNDVKHVLGGST